MKSNRTTSFLSQSRDSKITILLEQRIMDPIEVKELLSSLPQKLIAEQQLAKMYHQCSQVCDITLKNFASNQTTMFKEGVKVFNYQENLRLYAFNTEPINKVSATAAKINIMKSFTFELENQKNWVLRIDLIKSLDNPLEFKTKLSSAKKALIDTEFDSMHPSAYDHVEIKLEQLEPSTVSVADIADLIEEVQLKEAINEQYQQHIYSLAKDIFRDSMTISQFKRQSGFKRLCSNTVELSRPMFFKHIIPAIDTFYITDKIDGTRAMLVIDEVYRRSGHKRIFLGVDIKAISDKVYDIVTFAKPSTSSTIETDHTVLDVEMMEVDGKFEFYCFDVIALKSKRLGGYCFKQRFARFDEINTLMQKHDLGQVKKFIKLQKDTFASQIKELYSAKSSYHIDGIIFTPEGVEYKTAMKGRKNNHERIFNTGYTNTISFKWKPVDQLTIDFYLMAHSTKKGSYVLCSGVDTKTFKQLKLEFFEGYKAPASPNAHQYFPIQFEPYDGEFDYVWTPTKEELKDKESLDGLVAEFSFADENGLFSVPKLMRYRSDRVQDIAKGEYYGNALRYAELIWHSVKHPLTIENMTSQTDNDGYFADESTDWYKAQRNYNSFVKTYLMENYLYTPSNGDASLLDVAAGKGQDLARSIDIGFNEILLLDKDTDALYELLERKYNLRLKHKNSSANVHVKMFDLEDSAEDNIKLLKVPAERFHAGMISFAIHYIAHSAKPEQKDPLTEFAKFIAYNLKKGGRFMITTFNGEDIFKLLEKTQEWNLKENGRVKYSITKQYSSDTFTEKDQSIGVMLPFSGGKYYSEYLVNYDHLQKVFEANGFKLIKTDGFGSLMRTFKKQNTRAYESLTEEDKEYVSLYGFLIFEKL